MKSSYKPISDIVERVDIRNSDGNADILMGLSIDKCFIRSVANTVGTDLKKYKVIRRNQFAVSLMQVSRDSKIPVACFRECDRAIMSPAYSIFQVADESVVLPDYLDMWFKRAEFDREAAFIAVGGVRGSMPWEEFARIKVRVPTVDEQRSIVKAYQTITERIELKRRINDNLDASALAIYRKYFVDGIKPDDLPFGWSMGTLKDIYKFQYGKGNTNPDNDGQYPIYGSNGVIGGYHEYNNENEPVIGHIGAAGSLNFAFGKHYVTYNGIMCNILVPRNIYFGYLTLYAQNLAAQVRGSTQPFISYDMLYEIKTVLPTDDVLDDFHSKVSPVMKYKQEILSEITKLAQMQIIMQEQLSFF